ncbi:MAG: AMP-binding protein [Flavobacteriales bacterium]
MKHESHLQEHARSIADPAAFWGEQAQRIAWRTAPTQVLDMPAPDRVRWFADGELNMSHLCLDHHVANGRGDQVALIHDSPVTGVVERCTYRDLQGRVARLAGAMKRAGIVQGDTAVIYMPMVPEAVMAMLACARLGVVHSVVFGGFAPHELAVRIDDAKPKILFTAACGIEVDKVIPYQPLVRAALEESAHQPALIVTLERPQQPVLPGERETTWDRFVEGAAAAEAVWVPGTHPLYILYTSGTTGKPKGIVRDTGGYATALRYSMDAVYGARPGDTFWAASDVGWVVGHSYIVYAPLLTGCTTILFEGKPVRTPDAGTFWRVVQEHKVNVLFTAPTAIRAIRKEDPDGALVKRYDRSSLRTLFLAGERCDPATWQWSAEHLNVPVVDHWWQTESGWPMVATLMGREHLPSKAGSAGQPVPGYDVRVLAEDGSVLPPRAEGAIAVKLPLPPGCLPTLWNDHERFVRGYLSHFPGYYITGDGGYADEDGYLHVMGRVDDVINVAGHRLSTGEMEELLAGHHAVAECAVVGIADDLRGQVPVGLVVRKDGAPLDDAALERELIALIRDKIGAVAVFRHAVVVKRLPKTRSGKILRKTIRNIADGERHAIPSTIEDPAVLAEIHDDLKARGVGKAFSGQTA